MMTTYSTAIVRTTHVTGLVTDIGMLLGGAFRNLVLRKDRKKRRRGLWKLRILVPLTLGFFVGGILGALAFINIGTSKVLFFPAGIIFFLGLTFLTIRLFYESSVRRNKDTPNNVPMKVETKRESKAKRNSKIVSEQTSQLSSLQLIN